jgi:hypothetical protein
MLNKGLVMKLQKTREPDRMGSYTDEDVRFVLKDISNFIQEKGNEERENAVQTGRHYSEMLPIEYQPSKEYLDVFYQALESNALKVANAVAVVSEKILRDRGESIALVSLARAGTPIGILIKRYIKYKYGIDLKHYSISIIRDIGIDENALTWILNNNSNMQIQFIDGWTGKGIINKVLDESINNYNEKYNVRINPDLAVLADPAFCVKTFGTREDFLIPSACLNSTISGLVSRTVFRKDIIGQHDFHGAKYYSEWKDIDLSYMFINTICSKFNNVDTNSIDSCDIKVLNKGIKDVLQIQKDFAIDNINFVKPGVGETTRVLLRRVPWKILVDKMDNPNLKHILILAKERNVSVEEYDNMSYSCCGIIKPINKI